MNLIQMFNLSITGLNTLVNQWKGIYGEDGFPIMRRGIQVRKIPGPRVTQILSMPQTKAWIMQWATAIVMNEDYHQLIRQGKIKECDAEEELDDFLCHMDSWLDGEELSPWWEVSEFSLGDVCEFAVTISRLEKGTL